MDARPEMKLERVQLERIRAGLSRMAPTWQPRGLAVICLASVVGLIYTTIFPVDSEVDLARQGFEAGVTLLAGAACWAFAPAFRAWMVHLAVVIAFLWGLFGLAGSGSTLEASLTLTALLWIGVFVGAAFPPAITRAYAALVCAGIAVAMNLNGVHGDTAIGIAFAGSFVVIMEILSRTTSQLRREATTDPLTGLLNRNGLEREVRRVRSFGRDDRIAVLVADLDGLKPVNDSKGHQAGDRLLKEFARSWREGARSGDLIARIGGDEFVLVFPEVEERAAEATVERLRQVSPTPWSGGLVIAEPGESLESCVARADRLLYAEKASKLPGLGGITPSGAPLAELDRGVR